MPIYMRVEGLKGDVQPTGSTTGGVWKTSNFLTPGPVGRAASEPGLPGVTVFLDQNDSSAINPRPKIKTYICPSDTSAVQISRISLMPGGAGVEGRDPMAKIKVEQLINSARSQGPSGKLYLATDVGVFQNGSSKFDAQGRLLIGTEGGIWRSGRVQEAANRMSTSNNLKQLGLGAHSTVPLELIVTDMSNTVIASHLFRNATVSRHSGGILVGLGDGSVR